MTSIIDPGSSPIVVIVPPSESGVTVVNPTGPAGTPGGAPNPIAYDLAGASEWSHMHGFGYPPAVRFVDQDGRSVQCSVTYPDGSHVHISFPQPFTGTVVLS